MCAWARCFFLVLVGGWFSIILMTRMPCISCCRLHRLSSPSASCTAQAFATWNVEPCTHTCCVYVLYSISPSTAYVRTTAARGIEILLFGLDAIWYNYNHHMQNLSHSSQPRRATRTTRTVTRCYHLPRLRRALIGVAAWG
jgi:hypothetical protein